MVGSPPTLTRKKQKIQEMYGPMTSDEAGYVLAHQYGIDLPKYLTISDIDRIRSLIPRDIPIIKAPKVVKQKTKPKKKAYTSYPLINVNRIRIAHSLGVEIYPLLFILENSIRELINQKLSAVGSNWWETEVPAKVKNNVSRTMSIEKRYPYRDTRGNHPLLYANFSDLKEIILANKDKFSDVILDFDWFKVKMEEVYMARNNLAHCVPLSSDDRARIAIFHRDWARLLDATLKK